MDEVVCPRCDLYQHEPKECWEAQRDIRAENRELVASLAVLSEALNKPASNISGCECKRDSDEDEPLCPMHAERFSPLSWETLAFMCVDYEAYTTSFLSASAGLHLVAHSPGCTYWSDESCVCGALSALASRNAEEER